MAYEDDSLVGRHVGHFAYGSHAVGGLIHDVGFHVSRQRDVEGQVGGGVSLVAYNIEVDIERGGGNDVPLRSLCGSFPAYYFLTRSLVQALITVVVRYILEDELVICRRDGERRTFCNKTNMF